MSKHAARRQNSFDAVMVDVLAPLLDYALDHAITKQVLGDEAVTRSWTWRGRDFRFENRGEGAPMGRFGGGWQRNIGIQSGGTSVIISMWKSSLRITKKARS